jgi:hypothetical protein
MKDYIINHLLTLNTEIISQYLPLSSQKACRLINSRALRQITPLLANTVRIQNYSFSCPSNIDDQLARHDFQKDWVSSVVIRGEFTESEFVKVLGRFKRVERVELESFKLKKDLNNFTNGLNWLEILTSLSCLNFVSFDVSELPTSSPQMSAIQKFTSATSLKLKELFLKRWPISNIHELALLLTSFHSHSSNFRLNIESEPLQSTLYYAVQLSSNLAHNPQELSSTLVSKLRGVTSLNLIVNSRAKLDYSALMGEVFPNLTNFKVVDLTSSVKLFNYLPSTIASLDFNMIDFNINEFASYCKENSMLENLVIKQGQFLTPEILEFMLVNLKNLKKLEIYNLPLNMKQINTILSNNGSKLRDIKLNFRIFQSSNTEIELEKWMCKYSLKYLTLNNITVEDNKNTRELVDKFNTLQICAGGYKLNY